MKALVEASGMSQRRCERAIADLKDAGLMTVGAGTSYALNSCWPVFLLMNSDDERTRNLAFRPTTALAFSFNTQFNVQFIPQTVAS